MSSLKDVFDEKSQEYERRCQPMLERTGTEVDVEEMSKIVEGYHEVAHVHERLGLIIIRRGYRYFTGAVWKDAGDAVRRTAEHMLHQITSMCIHALARGVIVGEHEVPEIIRAKFRKDLTEVFQEDAVSAAEAAFVLSEVEEDLHERIYAYTAASFAGFGARSGYKDLEGDEIHHIWNLWLITSVSLAQTFYSIGVLIGEERRASRLG